MSSDENDPLKQFIDRTLRDLPLPRAPDHLLSQVLSIAGQHESKPWWRRAFHSWPAAAQGTFIVVCAALAGVAIHASDRMSSVARIDFSSSSLATVFKALATLHSSFVDSLPPSWLYGLLAVVGIVYFIAFGIGAIAYRSLYASR